MRILFVAAEVDPFAKTGGLADVAAALPRALEVLGHDVRIVLPRYRAVAADRFGLTRVGDPLAIRCGADTFPCAVWETRLPRSRIPVYCIEQDRLFGRDGIYQEGGRDYPDNLTRFSVFSQAALAMLPGLGFQPEIVHAHDWQAALACAQLAFGAPGRDPFFSSTKTVFTIHNLAYQGVFPRSQWPLAQLPDQAFSVDGLEFYGQLSCLKGGLCSAGVLTTVSPTYREEIQAAAFGCGLDGVLRARRERLVGILNGIDLEEWNPGTDPHLPARYTADDRFGKAKCTQALRRRLGLADRPHLLIGMIQRLAEQKGIDTLLSAMKPLLALPVQLVILGTGEPAFHDTLAAAAKAHPGQLAAVLAFDNALAHQIEAGADAFLMPSRFEPCGLNQMYSMRYGTVPIVHRVGGLADTVIDAGQPGATGFVFEPLSVGTVVAAIRRASEVFEDRAQWARLMAAGMAQDFSWTRSARAYADVYARAAALR